MRIARDATHPTSSSEQVRRYAVSAIAVAAAAAAGARAVEPNTEWYRSLRLPAWQPPPWAFGAVWTPLYASLAFAGGHASGRIQGRDRQRFLASLGTNLALNAGWNWLFFRLRNPRAALVGTVLLDVSNVQLIRRTMRSDRTAARALWPYTAWCLFATGLNASIAHRNPSRA
ncbi:TspO/MBR family protein [Streptomyces sp. NPDC002535]